MSGLHAPGLIRNSFQRQTTFEGKPVELKMREPLRKDLGNEVLNGYRDKLVDSVMNVAEALVPNDNKAGLDSDFKMGSITAKNFALHDDGASLGLASGGGRGVDSANVVVKRPTEDSLSYKGADSEALYVDQASIGFADGSVLWFRQEAGSLSFQEQAPDGQLSEMRVRANGDVEWNIHDPANFERRDWAQ